MNLSSYFIFTRQQRRGILFLLLLIALFQSIYFFVDFSKPSDIGVNNDVSFTYQKKIDSVKKQKKQKQNIFPFNPNYISDYKGYTLGMTVEEIDRLLNFRAQGKFIHTSKEFQQVTKISDTLLNKLVPYFKFPDWYRKKRKPNRSVSKTFLQNTALKKDLNKVTAKELQKVKGIGVKLSARIIKYRNFLDGFSSDDQLNEVYGLEEEVVKRMLRFFTVIEAPSIRKDNVNTISLNDLAKIPYISYEEAKKIITYRSKFGRINSIKDLRNIQDFSLNKINRIELYLTID